MIHRLGCSNQQTIIDVVVLKGIIRRFIASKESTGYPKFFFFIFTESSIIVIVVVVVGGGADVVIAVHV